MRRGILGGTFDPPHLAHLVAAESAYRQLELDEVIFLPAGAPWQKADRKLTETGHRWQMTVLATEGVEYFLPDDRELRRPGWTYTVETLSTFPAGDSLVLVAGADTARGLPSWERVEEMLERAHLAVAPRSGTSRREVEAAVGAPVSWLEMPELPISGVGLRRRLGEGESVRFLVPEPVWSYIERNRLYSPA